MGQLASILPGIKVRQTFIPNKDDIQCPITGPSSDKDPVLTTPGLGVFQATPPETALMELHCRDPLPLSELFSTTSDPSIHGASMQPTPPNW